MCRNRIGRRWNPEPKRRDLRRLTGALVYRDVRAGYTGFLRGEARRIATEAMRTQHYDSTDDCLGQTDNEVHTAVRFAALAGLSGIAFLILAALWDSTCTGATSVDTVACGAPQLTILAFGGPAILLGTGLWAFLRTYRTWRDHGTWWAWQGAGWFLMVLMFVTLTMSAPAVGPVLAS